jgi:hypothetical protein
MFDWLKDLFSEALAWIKNIVKKVINGVLNFANEVVGYFRNLKLDPKTQTPFLANMNSFKDKLKNAPVKNVGIFQGVYNEQTDAFEDVQQIEADGLDQQTMETLGKDALIVLS